MKYPTDGPPSPVSFPLPPHRIVGMKTERGPGVVRKQREAQGPGTEDRPWGEWQQDWFATPGDIDDFIFYDDLGEPEDDSDP